MVRGRARLDSPLGVPSRTSSACLALLVLVAPALPACSQGLSVCRKEVLEEEVYPPPKPMESQSTTQQDYHREGFLSVPPAPAKPHNYRLEQPQTFWLEHAQQVPGISNIRTGDTPFKKCATFTTPITEYLDQPLPYGPENYPKL